MHATQLTFGIEIECLVPTSAMIQRSSSHYGAGLQIHNAPAGWTAKRDGSLHNSDAAYEAIEVVSPILNGEEGLIQVAYMADFLKSIGTKVNHSCGMHVHVGASEIAGSADSWRIRALQTAYNRYESAFYGLNGYRIARRYNNTYCHPLKRWGGDRYNSINLHNVGTSRDTVEVRLYASTVEAYRAVSAVTMASALVNVAASYESRREASQLLNYDLSGMRGYDRQPQAVDPVPVMNRFIRDVIDRPDNLIIPSGDYRDIIRHMRASARSAEPFVANCH